MVFPLVLFSPVVLPTSLTTVEWRQGSGLVGGSVIFSSVSWVLFAGSYPTLRVEESGPPDSSWTILAGSSTIPFSFGTG